MVDPFALLRFWRAIFWRVGRRGCSTYTCTVVANHARNRRVFPTKAVPFIKQRLLQAGSARGQGSRQSLCSVSLLTLVSSRTISQHGQRACACPPACLQLHHGLVAGILFFKLNRKATVSFEIWLYKALKRISLSNALVWFKLMFFLRLCCCLLSSNHQVDLSRVVDNYHMFCKIAMFMAQPNVNHRPCRHSILKQTQRLICTRAHTHECMRIMLQ